MVQSLGLKHHKHQPAQGGPKEEAGQVSSVWQQMVRSLRPLFPRATTHFWGC